MAVNSFASVSMDPPMVLFCPAMSSATWPVLRQADGLAINFLAADQAHLGAQFAGRSEERFRDVDWAVGTNGAPLLAGAAGWIECRVSAEQVAGDHYVVLADSECMALNDQVASPLVFSCGRYLPGQG
jgi:3-hydroxy-9,10-secoandrosta-1,3,5(10)-triene-9,17-dione monooxygenase reductase component